MQPTITCERSTGLTDQQIRESRLFIEYVSSLQEDWRLLSFHAVWAVEAPRGEDSETTDIIMMFAQLEVRDHNRRIIQAGSLLRGGTVEVLPVLIDPHDVRHAVFVSQSRPAVGCTVTSTPAGMVNANSREVTVFTELEEELGRPLNWSEPVWLNEIITGSNRPLYVSPGGSSEVVSYCFVTDRVSFEEIDAFNDHKAGNADEGEHTETSIAPLDDLPESLSLYGVFDNKTVMIVLMYVHCLYMRGALE